jgi:hypothetical protein
MVFLMIFINWNTHIYEKQLKINMANFIVFFYV